MISSKNIFTMNMAKNIYLCLTGAGVVVFMYYCLRIGFLPTGLSLSDVIFFLMVIASFSLFLGIFLMFWYSISVVTSNFFLRIAILILRGGKGKNRKLLYTLKGMFRTAKVLKLYDSIPGHMLISFSGVYVVISGIMAGKIEAQSVFLSVFITSFCIALIPYVYIGRKVKKENKKKYAISISACMLFSFFVLSGMPPLLSDAGMSIIGVRKSNITVLLQGKDLEMARYLTRNQNQTYFKGDALFTGVGATSLLVINQGRIIVRNENLSMSY